MSSSLEPRIFTSAGTIQDARLVHVVHVQNPNTAPPLMKSTLPIEKDTQRLDPDSTFKKIVR